MPQSKASENYDHIILSDEQIQVALKAARKAIHVDNINREYWERVRAEEKPKVYSLQQFTEIFMQRATEAGVLFDIDNSNRSVVNLLLRYAIGDASIADEGYSLKKGILLTGGVGCGKTTILKLLTPNQHLSYSVISCRKVRDEFETDGSEALIKFSDKAHTMFNAFKQQEIGICFDDLGTEREARHYGNTKNVMEEIILNRYDKLPHHFTHITTNLSAAQIEEAYGTRVRSRLREMFNIISFDKDATDRRK